MTETGCGHDDAHRSVYSGTLCSPCYREIEMRIPGMADYCAALRRMAAPGTVSAVRLEERVQESGEARLIIDEHLLELADNLYLAASGAALISAPLIHTDLPYALDGVTKPQRYKDTQASLFGVMGVERWLDRNLQWIAALDEAAGLLLPLTDALTKARRAVDPSPPRKPAVRGNCRICLSPITIEVRERAIFYSTCGGCGETGPMHASVVEAVLGGRNDGDGSGESDRAHPDDAMELSGGGVAAVEGAGA